MNYFAGIGSLDQLKMRYRELCKMYHPDLGGDTEKMKDINAQYSKMLQTVKDNKGEFLNTESINIEESLMKVIEDIIALQGITIEVCGRWVWVTGNTKQYIDEFKRLGFWWASKKLAWYWRPDSARSGGHKAMTTEYIREKYGSIDIKTIERNGLPS